MSRLPSTIASEVGAREEIALRLVHTADDASIDRLEQLAERTLGARPLLVAEVDGQVVVAGDEHGDVISDPFRVTLDVVELVRMRAAQLRHAAA